jgi:hypothetical protein
MKMYQLMQAVPTLNVLVATKLPTRVAYRITKSISLINSELRGVEDMRINTAAKFGTLNKEKNIFEFAEGKDAEFQAAMAEVQNEECAVELPKFTLDELDNALIEPNHVRVLLDLGMLVEA